MPESKGKRKIKCDGVNGYTLLSLDRFSELGEVTILPVTAGN